MSVKIDECTSYGYKMCHREPSPMAHFYILAMVVDNSRILSVSWLSFPSILTNKYIDITIGKPKLAICV